MAMKHFEDMNALDLEAMVSNLLELDPKFDDPAPKPAVNFEEFCALHGHGMQRGELNIITSGKSL